MVKFCDSLLSTGSLKEGIKKLVNKFPSGFLKTKESTRTKHDDLNDYTSCLETPTSDLNTKISNNKKRQDSPNLYKSPRVNSNTENKDRNKNNKRKKENTNKNKRNKRQKTSNNKSNNKDNDNNSNNNKENKLEKKIKKTNEYFKLKFKYFNGSLNDFKALLDSNVKSLGSYNKVNFRPNKVVVSFDSKDVLDRYFDFYNKLNWNEQVLRVSVLDYYSKVKSDYKSLNLYGIPDEYDLESVQKGIRRRINLDFKLSRVEENKDNDREDMEEKEYKTKRSREDKDKDKKDNNNKEKEKSNAYKLDFKNVSDCVKANSILNNSKIPILKNKNEHLVRITTSMEIFGRSSRNSSRVFVRNLPFDVSYDELSSFFKTHDKGSKVHLPKNSKGYAFVTFSSLEKSKKVINELNGTMFKKRRIQLTLSLPKQLYSSNQSDLMNGIENGEDKDKEKEENNNKENKEKEKKQEKNKTKEEETLKEEKNRDKEDKDNKDNLDDTIFIRNLDYNCNEDELLEYFSKYGKVESCKICLNEDGSSKGTGFVRFKNREDVKKILEYEKLSLLRDEELNSQKPVVGIGFTLRGRRLKVDLALVKERAKILREQMTEEENKRNEEEKNLDLLMVGVITEDTDEFKMLSENQQELVKQSLKQKLEKIKQKNTYVNPKRICIKNIPSNVNSNELRNVINKYLKKTLNLEDYMKLKKMKNRGIVDVRLIKGDSYTKDVQGIRVKKKKPFAFVEFVDREIAMKVLEYFSNNDKLYKSKRLQCEFTIDTRYDKGIKSKNQWNRLRKKKYSRGKRQRERRRLMKMNETT